jgi:hypothetical protein
MLAFGPLLVSRTGRDHQSTRLHKVFQPLTNDVVIRVYDEAGNVIETHEHAGDFKEP